MGIENFNESVRFQERLTIWHDGVLTLKSIRNTILATSERKGFLVFLDYSLAFDSVDRESLFIILRKAGVPNIIVEGLVNLYGKHKFCVTIGDIKGEVSTPGNGLKQGCPCSPTLFLIYLDFFMNGCEWENDLKLDVFDLKVDPFIDPRDKRRVNHITHFSSLLWADDLAQFADSREAVINLFKKHERLKSYSGLVLNATKTKVLPIGDINNEDVLDYPPEVTGLDKTVETVDSFKYLGSLLDNNCNNYIDIQNRVRLSNIAVSKLRKILYSKKVWKKTKLKLLNCFVLPIISYGCVTWNLDTKECGMLDPFWNKQLRACLGVTKCDHIPNKEIYSRLGTLQLSVILKRRKASYTAHLARANKQSWAYKSLTLSLHNSRYKGKANTWHKTAAKLMELTGINGSICKDKKRVKEKIIKKIV